MKIITETTAKKISKIPLFGKKLEKAFLLWFNLSGEYNDEITHSINHLDLMGLEGLKVGDALHWAMGEYGRVDIKRRFPNNISIAKNIRIKTERKDTGKILFFAERDICRKDHLEWFHKIASLLDSYMYAYTDMDGEIRVSLSRKECIRHLRAWNKEFKKIKQLAFPRRMMLISTLLWHWVEYQCVLSLPCDYVHTYVFLSDAHCTSHLLAQYFNARGKRTVACCHGIFAGDYQYKCPGKYLLVYGSMVYHAACKAESDHKDKFIICGDPRLIDVPLPDKIQIKRNRILGVVLTTPLYPQHDNEKIIDIVSGYAEKNNYTVYYKMHPLDAGKEIPNELKNKLQNVYCNDISMSEFGELVDLAIFTMTTAYIELVAKLIPSFRLRQENDLYEEIDWCTFASEQELAQLIDHYFGDPDELNIKMLETREALTKGTEIGNNYKTFLEDHRS